MSEATRCAQDETSHSVEDKNIGILIQYISNIISMNCRRIGPRPPWFPTGFVGAMPAEWNDFLTATGIG